MKLDKKVLKALILESLEEAKFTSIQGGGEGSGIPTGQLSDIEQAMNEMEQMMEKFQNLKDSIEQIYQKELEKKNRPLPSPIPEKESDIPD